MNIAIIGTGKMARGLAMRFVVADVALTIAARDLDKARSLAAQLGNACTAASIAAAVQAADIVVLAVPYGAVEEVLAQAEDWAGKVVIDITNPISPDYMSLTIGHSTSAAEEIQKLAPAAIVVKAFNTIFAEMLLHGLKDNQPPVQVFYASDDQAADEQVAALLRAMGFAAVHCGPLMNARYLEPLAELNIHLGYALGWGTLTAPAWIKYAE